MSAGQADADTGAAGGQDESKAGDPPTMAEVMAEVRKVVDSALEPFKKLLTGGGGDAKPPADATPGSSPDAAAGGLDKMIETAIGKVLGQKEQDDKAAAHEAEHAKLRDAAAEKPPVARPRRSRWLGKIYDE